MKANQKIKYLVLGMIIMGVFSTVAMPAMAAMIQKQITVSTGVNIYVDDVKLNPVDSSGKPVEAFIYNGTTYLPVRAVADAVGKPVKWDGKTSSVYLGKHTATKPTVWLKNLEYFDLDINGYMYNTDMVRDLGTQKDNLGKDHYNCVGGGLYTYTYKLNGQYSKITGTLFMLYDTRAVSDTGILKIYGDGELLYEANVTKGVEPIEFSVDLTGILEMQLSFNGYNGSWGVGYSNYAALGNCGLWP